MASPFSVSGFVEEDGPLIYTTSALTLGSGWKQREVCESCIWTYTETEMHTCTHSSNFLCDFFFQNALVNTLFLCLLHSAAPIDMHCIFVTVGICQKGFPLVRIKKYVPSIMMMSICPCLPQNWLKLGNVKENNKEEVSNIFWLCFPLCVTEHESLSCFHRTPFLWVEGTWNQNCWTSIS